MPYLLNFPVDHSSNSFNLRGNSDQLTFEVQANLDLVLEHHIVSNGSGEWLVVYSAIHAQVVEYAKAFYENRHNIQVQDLQDDLGLLWDVWLGEDPQTERSPLSWQMRSVDEVPDMSGIRGVYVHDPMVPPGDYVPLTKVNCLIRNGVVIGYVHPHEGETQSSGREVYKADRFIFWFGNELPSRFAVMDLQAPTSPFSHEAWALGNGGREITHLPVVSEQN